LAGAAAINHQHRKIYNVNSLLKGSVSGKPLDPVAEREILTNSNRTAVACARLVVNALETIGVSLRHRQITTDEAMAWLHEHGLLDHIDFGPAGAES
jgi:hypothetical protein